MHHCFLYQEEGGRRVVLTNVKKESVFSHFIDVYAELFYSKQSLFQIVILKEKKEDRMTSIAANGLFSRRNVYSRIILLLDLTARINYIFRTQDRCFSHARKKKLAILRSTI